MEWPILIVGWLCILAAIVAVVRLVMFRRFAVKRSLVMLIAAVAVSWFAAQIHVLIKKDLRHGPALALVLKSIPKGEAHTWQLGDLEGGVAVVVNKYAGYWVKDGTVYATDGIGKNMARGVEYSPPGINMAKVEATVME